MHGRGMHLIALACDNQCNIALSYLLFASTTGDAQWLEDGRITCAPACVLTLTVGEPLLS